MRINTTVLIRSLAALLGIVAIAAAAPLASVRPAPQAGPGRLPLDSSNCRLVANWPDGPTRAIAMDPARNLAFSGNGGGVDVLDVSNPAHPVKLSDAIQTPGLVEGLFFVANRLYIADYNDGLRIWDVSVPARPQEIDSCRTAGSAYGVAVVGSYAYVAEFDSGLSVINVGDSAHPREVGHCATPGWAEGVAVAGVFAYVADVDSGLRVINVSDTALPQEVGYYATPSSVQGVAVAGGHVYVADLTAGLRVVDAADPVHPLEVGYYDTPGHALAVAVVGDLAYVADYGSGLQIIEFLGSGVAESRTPHAIRPTPYAGPTVVRNELILELSTGVQREASCALLNIAGREMQRLHSGQNDVSWLAPGVYFVREEPSAVRKVIIAE